MRLVSLLLHFLFLLFVLELSLLVRRQGPQPIVVPQLFFSLFLELFLFLVVSALLLLHFFDLFAVFQTLVSRLLAQSKSDASVDYFHQEFEEARSFLESLLIHIDQKRCSEEQGPTFNIKGDKDTCCSHSSDQRY